MVSPSSPVPKLEPETLTLAEVAARFRIGMTKAHELARNNAFPFPTLRLGREYRFPAEPWTRTYMGQTPTMAKKEPHEMTQAIKDFTEHQ